MRPRAPCVDRRACPAHPRAQDEKSNAQEFYESLERIVVDLRNWTVRREVGATSALIPRAQEHSFAFLNKVRKAEAPNYYDGASYAAERALIGAVIKRPMDLGTVLKKVKAQSYKDKKDFAADLDLIWSNCMEYNSLPVRRSRRSPSSASQDHPLRRSALLLRNRANQHLQFVMDSPTVTKPNLFGTPDLESDDGRPTPSEDQTDRTRKGVGSRKRAANGAGSMSDKSRVAPPTIDMKPSINAEDAMSDAAASSAMDVDGEAATAIERERTESPGPAVDAKSRSSSQLPHRGRSRGQHDHVPFPDRPAIVRTASGMGRWVGLEPEIEDDGPIASTSAHTLDDLPPVSASLKRSASGTLAPPAVSPYKKPLPLAVQQLIGGPARTPRPASPAFSRAGSDDSDDDERPLRGLGTWFEDVATEPMLSSGVPRLQYGGGRSARKRRRVSADPLDGPGLAPRILANLSVLERVRRLHRQVVDLVPDEPSVEEASIGFEPVEGEDERAVLSSRLGEALESPSVAPDEAARAMAQLSGVLAAHAGFDGALALPEVTDLLSVLSWAALRPRQRCDRSAREPRSSGARPVGSLRRRRDGQGA